MADLRVESLLGSNVRCQLVSGPQFEAELYGADGATLVFRGASDAGLRSYRIVNTSQIVSLEALENAPEGLESSTEPWGQPLPPVINDRLALRLDAAIRDAERQAEMIGVGVSVEAQLLFNALSKTMPCRWSGETIIVMDEVRIEKPYGIESCTGGAAASLRRVQKVVDGEKRKLAKTGGSV